MSWKCRDLRFVLLTALLTPVIFVHFLVLPSIYKETSSFSTIDAPSLSRDQTKIPYEAFEKHPVASKNHTDNSLLSKRVHQQACLNRPGVIIWNAMGRLANNLFEYSFAKHLSQELCWPLLKRVGWQGPMVMDSKAALCFPNAALRKRRYDKYNISLRVQHDVGLNKSRWKKLSRGGQASVPAYYKYLRGLQTKGMAMAIEHENEHEYYHAMGVDKIRDQLVQNFNISVLSLSGFFIQSDLMLPWKHQIEHWLSISPTCCSTPAPPLDAVVIHIRDFDPTEVEYQGIGVGVYQQILAHYNLTNRPLWIVCPPKSAKTDMVQTLINVTHHTNAFVIPGKDAYDALCILTRAKTLILTSASTFSQMGGFLSKAQQIHYPVRTLQIPATTIHVPGWKYHLAKEKTGVSHQVQEFDVDHERINFY